MSFQPIAKRAAKIAAQHVNEQLPSAIFMIGIKHYDAG